MRDQYNDDIALYEIVNTDPSSMSIYLAPSSKKRLEVGVGLHSGYPLTELRVSCNDGNDVH